MYVEDVTTAACGIRAREILSQKAAGSQICLLAGRGYGDQPVLHVGWKPRGGCLCGTGSQGIRVKIRLPRGHGRLVTEVGVAGSHPKPLAEGR